MENSKLTQWALILPLFAVAVTSAMLVKENRADVAQIAAPSTRECAEDDPRPHCKGRCVLVGVSPPPGEGCYAVDDCCQVSGGQALACTSRQQCDGDDCETITGACVYRTAVASSSVATASPEPATEDPFAPSDTGDGEPAVGAAAVCGNGSVEQGEQCDLGSACQPNDPASCNKPAGTPGAACLVSPADNLRADVTYASGCQFPACGDGIVNNFLTKNGTLVDAQLIHEECDDGNRLSGDGCSMVCATETAFASGGLCGNHLLNDGEECDDGNADDGDGCSAACSLEEGSGVRCGDGVVTPGEMCDAGDQNRPAGTQGAMCACNPNGASCQERPDLSYDIGCTFAVCGDGVVNNWAVAKNGTATNYEYTHEECDDGNAASGDGCSVACRLEDPSLCGNASVDQGEQCDDGNTVNGDGCSAQCQTVDAGLCGNRTLDRGEQCDDGNRLSGDGCSALCLRDTDAYPFCGNGTVDAGEQCDDGGRVPGDGCSEACQAETAQVPVSQVQQSSSVQVLPPIGSVTELATTHPAAGKTGPEVLAIMALGAAGGYAWMRQRRKY